MRRWNGWGDESVAYALHDDALGFLAGRIGGGKPFPDAPFDAACASLSPSRLDAGGLPAHIALATDAPTRLRHALGQSLPDWLRLRYGCIGPAPDAVAFPESGEDVRTLLDWASSRGVTLIAHGGGTSVAGHVTAPASARPVLTVSLVRLSGMLHLDREAQLATFGAGVFGPDLEAQLRAQGYVLGHYPQSYEYSTLGGWIATRSSGQQSLRYGRIEQLFAAGTDLREIVLGSEGRVGIITQATVRVTKAPEYEAFHAVFFASWEDGIEAARALAQSRPGLSLLRLSNPLETVTMLALAGHRKLVGLLERWLRLRGCGDGKCMLLLGASGTRDGARAAVRTALGTCRQHRGVHVGRKLGEKWRQGRFRNVYLRNAAWQHGYAIDTVETAVDWPRVGATMGAVEAAAADALAQYGEAVHAYTHLSHLYPQGASVYSTFVYRLAGSYEEDMARWRTLKSAVSQAIVASGGTISHQHGVGIDHAPWLEAEKGREGMAAIRAVLRHFDPEGLLNPGKLLADGEAVR